MLTPVEMKTIAAESIKLARALGNYQNSELTLSRRRGWLGRVWTAVVGRRDARMHPMDVTKLVSALLNGGNTLEQIARELEESNAPRP